MFHAPLHQIQRCYCNEKSSFPPSVDTNYKNLAHRCAKHSLERKGTIVPLLSSILIKKSKIQCLAKITTQDQYQSSTQGVKVGTLGRQNERNSSYVRLAHTSIFGLCFMSVCLMKSNCYSLIYSSLNLSLSSHFQGFSNKHKF